MSSGMVSSSSTKSLKSKEMSFTGMSGSMGRAGASSSEHEIRQTVISAPKNRYMKCFLSIVVCF